MTGRKYLIYDVFTRTRLAGNQLAIVIDGEGLETQAMQAIAREFNLSETVFVMPAKEARHRAGIRIFTKQHELPFAGHPTVGTAVALSEMAADPGAADIFVLEEAIGPVRCAVKADGDARFCEFDLARLPEPLPLSASPEAIGAALGLDPHEIGFENHRVSFWSAGVPYVCVPVAGLKAMARVELDARAWAQAVPGKPEWPFAAPYAYCRETVHHDSAFHVRMIVPGSPPFEDPATGSAAAAFAGAVMRFDRPGDGASRFWLEQGLEMGRPSRIRLELEVRRGALASVRIGGHAVKIAEGTLFA